MQAWNIDHSCYFAHFSFQGGEDEDSDDERESVYEPSGSAEEEESSQEEYSSETETSEDGSGENRISALTFINWAQVKRAMGYKLATLPNWMMPLLQWKVLVWRDHCRFERRLRINRKRLEVSGLNGS